MAALGQRSVPSVEDEQPMKRLRVDEIEDGQEEERKQKAFGTWKSA
jgi:hypothetical protein